MNRLSEILCIYAASSDLFGRQTSRRAISFDPSENLEIRSIRVISLKAASPVATYMPPAPSWCRPMYIPTGVSRFSFLLIRVFQDLQTKSVRKAHTLWSLRETMLNNNNYKQLLTH